MSHEMTHEEETSLALTVSISALHKQRDDFAKEAMTALITGRSWNHIKVSHEVLIQLWADSAYELADAMLRAKFKEMQ